MMHTRRFSQGNGIRTERRCPLGRRCSCTTATGTVPDDFTGRRPKWKLVAYTVLVAAALQPFPAMPSPTSANPAEDAQSPTKTYHFPGYDNPIREHVPLKPATKNDEKRRQALSWYMIGQIRERRNDFRGAYEAYRKAVKIAPKAIEVYRSLVPLGFKLNRNREAIQFAQKAVELDPDDYRLARTLAVFMASQRRIPEAVKLLETAVTSKRLDHRSSTYVTIQRDLGLLYRALGETEKAAEAYFVVFEARIQPKKYDLDERTRRRLNENDITSFERIGQVFLDANRPQLAIKAFRAAQKEREGKPGSLNYNLAKVYYETKQYDKALSELKKYLNAQLQTKGRAAYALLADILKAQNNSKQLIPLLEAAAKKDARNNTLQYFLAEQYVAADRLKDAEKLYKTTMAGSDDSEALLGLAVIYRKQKRPQAWLKALAGGLQGIRDADDLENSMARVETEVEEVAKNKTFVGKLMKRGRQQATAKPPTLKFGAALVLAKLAAESEQIEPAVLFYRFALKTRPEVASVLYGELGSYLLLAEKYAEAARVFQDAVNDPTLRSSRPNFLFRLSQAHELAGNTDAALKAVREAQKILPGVALLQYQEGWIYYHARQWDKAIPILEKVIRQYPSSREIVKRCRFSLSNIYVLKGNIRRGEAILEKVYAEDPDDISVNNDLGYLWADQGKNLIQAEKMIRKAVEAEPENPAYLDSMGWVLYKLGRYKEAMPWLEKAVKLPGGGDATIWDHLGDCYEKLGRHQDAVNAWKNALQKAEDARFKDDKLIKALQQKLQGRPSKPVPAERPGKRNR